MSAVIEAPSPLASGRTAAPAPAAPRGTALRSRVRPTALGLLSVAACLLLWQVAATRHWHLGFVSFALVPPPLEVVGALWALLQSPRLAQHIGYSLWRVGGGFAAAALLGIVLGLLVGRLRAARELLLPPLEVLRPIPAVAWIPLSILAFPSSELSMIFITFVGALFPILLNTIHGAESVDPRLVASARGAGSSSCRWCCRRPRRRSSPACRSAWVPAGSAWCRPR